MLSPNADDPETALKLAEEAMRSSEIARAESLYRSVLSKRPNHPVALGRLGQLAHEHEKFVEATGYFSKLAELYPAEPMYWMNLGTAKRCAGLFDEALYSYARAAALGANDANFYYNVALAHIERNDYESARNLLAKAFQLSPGDAEIRFRYASCCYECMQIDEALAALDGWDERQTQHALASDIGHLLLRLGDPFRAEPVVRQAATENAKDPRAQLTLAQLLERTNRVEESEQLVAELMSSPTAIEILGQDLVLLRAQLAQRKGDHTTAVALFSQALETCTELHNRHFQEFPLAKSLDALGRYDEAFQMVTAAHESQVAYVRRAAPKEFLRGGPPLVIAEHDCDPEDVRRWDQSQAPDVQHSPVFIVAFPRSGTTLLELTLDAHPLLASMDEQIYLQNALDDLMSLRIRYPARLAEASHEQLENIRARYWQRVRTKVEIKPGQRLVDKNPLNMLRLPLIKRLFPHAHVIMAIRHPCDVILSCFMQHFRAPDFVMLCRDLPTLAAGYRKSFDFWYRQQPILEPVSMELRYEGFVDEFERHAREIIDFLALPWDDAVLAPGRRAMEKRFISTPSYSQVVQPVNKKAVGRWRNYRRYFDEPLAILRPYLERWGYES